eukprot:3267147-Amphidinium_carterae.1
MAEVGRPAKVATNSLVSKGVKLDECLDSLMSCGSDIVPLREEVCISRLMSICVSMRKLHFNNNSYLSHSCKWKPTEGNKKNVRNAFNGEGIIIVASMETDLWVSRSLAF